MASGMTIKERVSVVVPHVLWSWESSFKDQVRDDIRITAGVEGGALSDDLIRVILGARALSHKQFFGEPAPGEALRDLKQELLNR